MIGSPTIAWRDGLELTRVMTARGQIVLWLTWQGVRREVRLGKRVSEIRRVPKRRKR